MEVWSKAVAIPKAMTVVLYVESRRSQERVVVDGARAMNLLVSANVTLRRPPPRPKVHAQARMGGAQTRRPEIRMDHHA